MQRQFIKLSNKICKGNYYVKLHAKEDYYSPVSAIYSATKLKDKVVHSFFFFKFSFHLYQVLEIFEYV